MGSALVAQEAFGLLASPDVPCSLAKTLAMKPSADNALPERRRNTDLPIANLTDKPKRPARRSNRQPAIFQYAGGYTAHAIFHSVAFTN